MRLRDGYVIPEAGELAAMRKSVAFLEQAARVVSGKDGEWLTRVATDLRGVVDGIAPGVQLPKKRAKQESNGEAAPDTTDHEPGDSHIIESPQEIARHPQSGRYRVVCDKCGDESSGAESRAGRSTCYKCAPLTEGATE